MRRIAAEACGASTGELVEAVAVIASELASREAPQSAVACMELAEGLGAAIDVGEAALARLVHRVDSTGEVRRWRFASTSAWLRCRLGMRAGRAKERTTLAQQLVRLPLTAKRLQSSELSYGYAATVAEAVSRLDDQDATAGEEILLELADEGESAGQVAKAGYRITEVIAERDGREVEPQDARRGFKRSWLQRHVHWTAGCGSKDGCHLNTPRSSTNSSTPWPSRPVPVMTVTTPNAPPTPCSACSPKATSVRP